MEEIDYLEEPDMFHDVFAHVPMLTDIDYTNFFQNIGQLALEVINDEEKLKKLQRLYWFTIEFGLMETANGNKIYGAGIISSKKCILEALKINNFEFSSGHIGVTKWIDEIVWREFYKNIMFSCLLYTSPSPRD